MAVLERAADAAGTGSMPRLSARRAAPAAAPSSAPTYAAATTTTPAAPGQPAASGRVAWIDMSRGLAVVLVVLFHVTIGHYYLMDWADYSVIARWDRINQLLSVIRLPLLFALSGMLAAGKIRRGFRGGRAIEGALANYYLYAVWLGLYGLFVLLIPGDYPAPHKVGSFDQWIVQLWVPNTYLWYVFALAIYLVAFTALRRVPAWAVLGGLYLLHVAAAAAWTVESPLWTRSITYALLFGMGVYGGRALAYMASRPLATLATGLLSYGVYQFIGMTRLMSPSTMNALETTVLLTLYTLLGLTAVGIMGILARVPGYARVGSYLGQRTLGIYVLHIPMSTLLSLSLLGPLAGIGAVVAPNHALQVAYPVLSSVVVVLACIAAELAIRRTRAGQALFGLPAALAELCAAARATLNAPSPVIRFGYARRVAV